MNGDSKMCTSTFRVVNLPNLFSAWSMSSSTCMCGFTRPRLAPPPLFFPQIQILDGVLWLAELKRYTRVRHKFSHVYPNQHHRFREVSRVGTSICCDIIPCVMFLPEQLSRQVTHYPTSPILFVPSWIRSFLTDG
jgi:hypothetical protein